MLDVVRRTIAETRERAAAALAPSRSLRSRWRYRLGRAAIFGRRLTGRLAHTWHTGSPRNLVRVLGAIVAVITALSVPIGYCIIGYLKEADALTYKAELTAARAAQYIYAPDAPWSYDTDQLAAISEIRTPTAVPIFQRILDTKGKPMLQKGADLAWPTFARSAPIIASSAVLGHAEVSASLRPLLGEVFLIGVVSLLLGIAAYMAFAVLPLKVVDRSFRELEGANNLLRHREEALETQYIRLDAALESMVQGLAMFDSNERIVIANDRYAEIFGLNRQHVKPGTSLQEIVERRIAKGHYAGQKADDILKSMRARLARETASHFVNRLADGRVIAAVVQPRGDGSWVITHQDVTEQEHLADQLAKQNALLHQREEELQAQNMRFDAALENMFQGLAMFDAEERIVIANDRFAEMYGLTPEQVKAGTTLRRIAELRIASGLYAGLTADDVIATMRERVARGKVSHLTSRLGDGRTFTVSIRPRPDGGWVTTHQDVTEREALNARLEQQNALLQQREEELKAQNTRFDAAMRNMSQGLCLFDADQRVVLANGRYAEIYGLTPEQVKPGTTLRQIFESRAANGVYNHIDAQKFVNDGVSAFGEEVAEIVRLSDGRSISVLRRPMPDGGLVSTHEDVTVRQNLSARLEEQNGLLRQREEELRAWNLRLDAALKNMSQGLCLYDADQRVVIANSRFAEIYGLTPDQVKAGTTLRSIVEARIANGLYAGPSPEDYIQERLAAFDKGSVAIQRLSDGRDIAICRQPMRGGGWVTTHEDVTEREQLKERLEQQNEQLDAALNNMTQGLAMFDGEQQLVVSNDRYAEMYRLTSEQVKPGTTLRQLLEYRVASGCHNAGGPEHFVDELVEEFNKTSSGIHELADGRIINVRRRKTANGGHVVTHEDITERQKLNALLEQNNRLLSERTSKLQTIIDNFPGGISFLDPDFRVVLCNEKARRLLDLPDGLFAGGPPSIEDIFRFNAHRGEYGSGDAEEQVATRMAVVRERQAHVLVRERPDGTVLDVRGVPLNDGGFVTTYMDITERRRSEEKIAHMALHDALTGLANRVLLNEQLEQALTRVKRGEMVAVHLLDLDHFKNVNDTLGHPAGDKLLKDAADRLRALVRETDTIARMGGDEFAILQVAINQPADATALAHRVIESVSRPYELDGRQVVIGTSVGIAVGPVDGLASDQLMRNADLALYRAKDDGRGTYRFFEPEMDAQMQERRGLEYDLRKALTAGEFELYYQPVVHLETNKISGFEALIRWRHPEKGLISPGTFIPLAEEIGFIVPLGEWVIRQACATAAKWPAHIRISVNLSPVQFKNPGLVQVVMSALATSGVSADRLELEITESALLDDSDSTLAMLYRLREIGVRIAMDDFGTGYSSLAYLQSFPFDRIKIDRSFIKDIADGVGSLNIVRAMAALAKGLGMETTAEGVETNEQLDTVKSEGCTEMQGFLFSRPLPANELEELLSQSDNAVNAA
jgi:diguanylate cyclase (GGDEF)-like protein/PAS domain S-box-containing protein